MGLYAKEKCSCSCSGANIAGLIDGMSDNITATNSSNTVTVTINDKTIALSCSGGTSTLYYNIYACDTVGFETVLIVTSSALSTLDTIGTYTTGYVALATNVDGKLVKMGAPGVGTSTSYCIANLFNVPWYVYAKTREPNILTRCIGHSSTGNYTEPIIAPNLYISANVVSAGFKAIVSDGVNRFINIGHIFYLPYSDAILEPSTYVAEG